MRRERAEWEHITSTRRGGMRVTAVATRCTRVRSRGRWRKGARGRLATRRAEVSRSPTVGERVERRVPARVWRGRDSFTRAKKGRDEGRGGGRERRGTDGNGERGRREEDGNNTKRRVPSLSTLQLER